MFRPTNTSHGHHQHWQQPRTGQQDQPMIIDDDEMQDHDMRSMHADYSDSDDDAGIAITDNPNPHMHAHFHTHTPPVHTHTTPNMNPNPNTPTINQMAHMLLQTQAQAQAHHHHHHPHNHPPQNEDGFLARMRQIRQQQHTQPNDAQAQAQARALQHAYQQQQHAQQLQEQHMLLALDSERKLRGRYREARYSALSVLLDREVLMVRALNADETLPQARRRFTSTLISPQDPEDAAAINGERWTVPYPSNRSGGGTQFVSVPMSVVDIHETGDEGWTNKPGVGGLSGSEQQGQRPSQSPAASPSPAAKGRGQRTPQRGSTSTPGSRSRRRSGMGR